MLSLSKFNYKIHISQYEVKCGSISITFSLLSGTEKDYLKSDVLEISVYVKGIKIHFVVKPIYLSSTLYLPICWRKKASS